MDSELRRGAGDGEPSMSYDDLDVPLADMEHVDYTDDYNETYGTSATAVHAAGREMLVVWDESKKEGKRTKKKVLIESFTLSRRARPGSDDFAAVRHGPDSDEWTGKDARNLLAAVDRGESAFKHVSLF